MLLRGQLAMRYIFFQMLPSLFLGIIVFIFILLMFQALRLTEFFLVHGVELKTLGQIIVYLTVGFLPVILPMSLLFSVLSTYGRLSQDSEIVAFKALGLNMKQLIVPAIILATMTASASAYTSFYLAPWGNRQFEVLINELSQMKAAAQIKAGVFSDGFFDMVIYANQVDSKNNQLKKVFIFDERDAKNPLTIIANEGLLLSQRTRAGQFGQLRLIDGNIHRTQKDTYTKVDFKTYDIHLFSPNEMSEKTKSFPSLNYPEIQSELAAPNLPNDRKVRLLIEYHRRWALAIACMIFAVLGVGLGTVTNKRSAKANGTVLSIMIIVAYWVLYVTAENMAKKEFFPVWLLIWSINILFALLASWSLLRQNPSKS